MKFTRQGYGELTRDGVLISRHVVPEEAYERAASEPGVYVYTPAPIKIEVEGERYTLDGGGPIEG